MSLESNDHDFNNSAETDSASPSPRSFDVPITVRFFEADRAGVTFFGRVFEYAHAAEEELLDAAGCHIRINFDERGWGLPIRHAESDFRRPLLLGERLRVAVSVHRVGTSSITFQFAIRGEEDEAHELPRVTVRLTQVCVALSDKGGEFEKRRLPEELLAGLRRLGLLEHLEEQPKGSGLGK